MRTVVTFESTAFNTSESKPHFINPGCYGDDLARWLMAQLQAVGISTDAEPGQEDFGWYFTFRPGRVVHQLVLGFRPEERNDLGTWIGWLERDAGLLGSLLGARNRGIEPAALQAIHDVLSGSDKITAIRWHEKSAFDAGNEDAGRSQPDAA